MRELSKSISRRLNAPNFVRQYFCGDGLDIGGLSDPLFMYEDFFPLMKSVKVWDKEQGDAQYLEGQDDESLDFVHSSHCLEHMADPKEALQNWLRALKSAGYLVLLVPDEDMYEQGVFPSANNPDHKWTFSIYKRGSWSSGSINIIDLIQSFDDVAVEKIELLNATFRRGLPRYDQTISPVGECSIEVILRKLTPSEYRIWRLCPSNATVSCRTKSTLQSIQE